RCGKNNLLRKQESLPPPGIHGEIDTRQWYPSHRGSQTVYDHIAAIATMNATTAMKAAASKSDISHMVRSHCPAIPLTTPRTTGTLIAASTESTTSKRWPALFM